VRSLALVLALSLVACGPASTRASGPSPTPAPSTAQVNHLPPPSAHPNYPPKDLADLVALAEQGIDRRFLGGEGQHLESCSRAWDRVYEPNGVSPKQTAADLLKVAIERRVLLRSCGGFIFGTTSFDNHDCNCYHGENGYLEIDRGKEARPSPGKMLIIFEAKQNHDSASNWSVIVDQADL